VQALASSNLASSAVWEESLVSGDIAGRSATGPDEAGRAEYTLRVFVGGALIGIGGSALFGGFQEAIDRWIPRDDSKGE
jgi:hypothetical protein